MAHHAQNSRTSQDFQGSLDSQGSRADAQAGGLSLRGIHVPLITPFTAGGGVAADALEALAHQVLEEGAGGIVALGTTAEAASLDAAERDLVTGVCARVCRERGAVLTVGEGVS
ncbi:dihydrodipicolinate synthase family protein, partial [Streptomyces toxytricini]|uniref:dihydrodipicolinate synthase family protein n=1 Tax=Streptomyces toxytricini TaxID=67369 RepID=UPI00343511F2